MGSGAGDHPLPRGRRRSARAGEPAALPPGPGTVLCGDPVGLGMLPASGALHNGLPGALLLAACVELVVAPQFRHLGVVQLDRPPYSSCWSLSHFGFLLKTQDDSDRLECATFEKCLKNCVSWALKTAPREEFQIPVNRGNSLESVYRFPRGQLCSWGRPDGRGQNSVVGGPIYSFQKSNSIST